MTALSNRLHMRLMDWSRLTAGFARLWGAMVLSLMLAATPSMAAHMDLPSDIAPSLASFEQEQADRGPSHPHPVDHEQTASDCQDVCCSGTCVSATLTGESAQLPFGPRAPHEAVHVTEHIPNRSDGLLRPPRI